MTDYQRIQLDIIVKSEKPHEFGLRHRGISGSICSWILRDFLRKEFPHTNFDEGIVCKAKRKGSYLSDQFSPQVDIIVYHGDPWEKLYEYVVVPTKNVFLIIEVKKWISKGDVNKSDIKINSQISKFRNVLNKPIFLVAFRTTSDIQHLKVKSIANNTYIFSKGLQDNYPDYVENFQNKHLVNNELECLVHDIKKIIG